MHGAERITMGATGRPPTTLARVDEILDTGINVKYDPVRDTIKVRAGRLYVVVSGSDPNHIVTAMIPR